MKSLYHEKGYRDSGSFNVHVPDGHIVENRIKRQMREYEEAKSNGTQFLYTLMPIIRILYMIASVYFICVSPASLLSFIIVFSLVIFIGLLLFSR